MLTTEAAQQLFASHYRVFRELLNANHHTLEAMADMEKARQEKRTLSMTFIRARCTSVTVNVFKIIRNFDILTRGRHAELKTVFSRLQDEIDALLDCRQAVASSGELILPLAAVSRSLADATGEKMANLGEAGTIAGIHVPPGFVVTATSARLFFTHNSLYPRINHLLQQLDITNLEDLHRKSAVLQQLVREAPLPAELESLLYRHYDELAATTSPFVKLVVRSSALGEDLGHASFAGLYHSEIGVDRDRLVTAYTSVLASKYSPGAISYRLAKGFRHEETEMCVGCLAMIEAETSGVCYSRSLRGRLGTLDLFFAAGLATDIVDGTRTTDHLLVERTPPHAVVHHPAGPETTKGRLNDTQASALASIAMALEGHFGSPQDIEWSIDKAGIPYVLQTRPISVPQVLQRAAGITAPCEDQPVLHGGTTGCAGAGCGPVCIVRTVTDMLRFPRRAVLVVEHPLPEWAPLLKRATALVAATGGEAGHLATLSREFGLPSLLGLDQATNLLVNGETITVDATGHAVYRGRVEELLDQSHPRPNHIEGSPVQKTLTEVLQHISPLHLTAPSAPEFHAASCRTMHDITRFCHEQAVKALFDFSSEYCFEPGAAKHLRSILPLEFWAINLGDSFHPRYDRGYKYITIDDIVSVPMLAFWEGMHAVAWDGPPPVSLRTAIAFLLQSALRSGSDPAPLRAMGRKNYFLLSENYCNLSVRLGYHYAMIEAFIANRRNDRYITFRFKGGAAGEDQRIRRIELLADILTRFDFRVDLIGDALTARVERQTNEFLGDRLKVLGYLTIHTRQLDMVMTTVDQQHFYRKKFTKEIEEMLNNGH